MTREGVDLLVVGGGITGAGIARDAAMRGISVGLIERGDFASGTSSRSSKLIHGGLRYLQQGEIGMVLESARERQCLTEIAPHLAHHARMAMPVHGRTRAGLLKFRTGLWAFEKLAKPPKDDRHELWSREESLAHMPGLESDNLQGTIVYTEYITDDARLTLETLKSAKRYGARIINRAPATSLAEEEPRTSVSEVGRSRTQRLCVGIRDELSGKRFEVRASVVVNAAGPWVDAIRKLGGASRNRMQLSKGIHLVLPRERLPVNDIVVMRAPDKRMVFVVPWEDIVWIGTTDTFYPKAVERPEITREEVDYLLDSTNRAWPEAGIDAGDVRGAWAGVRPLLRQEGKKPSEVSRKDEVLIEPNGLLSIAGGKLTTYRKMAERVVDAVVERLEPGAKPCRTAKVPLVEGETPVPMVRTSLSAAEIEYAIDEECAISVVDVLERRARANLFAGDNGLGATEAVAAALAARQSWSDEQIENEIQAYRARVAEDVAWRQE
ncbi:MAG: glycerol-3-phosphate dehydrogenase/oxidase [Deltaproteobacteria bacterium]